MFNLHTIYVITLVSQATSALLLSLLAWADRRSRWLVSLAAACALHAAAIYLMPLWRGAGLWLPHAFSAAILIAMLYLIYLGLQALVLPQQRRSARLHAVLAAMMLVVFALAYWSSMGCIEVSEAGAIALLAGTIRMLWMAPMRELRAPLRGTALLLLAILLSFLARLPLEPLGPSTLLLSLRGSTMLLVSLMAFSFLALYAAESRRRLQEETRTDVLTGLLNRRAMEEVATREVKLAARNRWPCFLLLMDLDEFKRLNDTYGHPVGDQALLGIGGLLSRAARELENCTVARMGGEEFVALLANASVLEARALAERICDETAALRLRVGDTEVCFTASVGVSALRIGESNWSEMLRRADAAMYEAKRAGRNRVIFYEESALGLLER